jgi:dienelactone hydrolase
VAGWIDCIQIARFALVLHGCVWLIACSAPDLRRDQVSQTVSQASWQALDLDTAQFVLRAYVPVRSAQSDVLTIYIEGDGQAWLSESQPSTDPTPRHALALELAMQQPDGNAVYLARPCQFVEGSARRNCRQPYWTFKRFAPEVVSAMDHAVAQLKQQRQAKRLRLVGYSGGGAIASLLSARRQDVERLITVAGNLDHVTWTGLHHLSPLAGSLNPADLWADLHGTEQVHFVGEDDRIMPAQVAMAYRNRFPAHAPIALVHLTGFDHRCCWVNAWPTLWRQSVVNGSNATKVE